MEGVASVKLPSDHDKGTYVAHPVFMDTLLHVAGFVANMQGGVNDAYICSEVGAVKAIPELIDNNASYTVYISNSWVESEGVTIAEAYAVLDSNPRRIVAHLKDMHFRRVRLNSLKKGLAHAAGKAPHAAVKPHVAPVIAPKVPAAAPKAPSVDVSGEIVKIVTETCDISAASVDVNTDLGSLGVDSLMSIEIFSKLQAIFPTLELDAQALSHCQSISDIIREVSKQTNNLPVAQPAPSSAPAPPALVAQAAPIASSAPVDVIGLVSRVVSDTCGISLSAIEPDTDLNSLGVDSLMSIEIFGRLEEVFPNAILDATVLSHCRSVSDIVKHIPVSSVIPSEASVASSPRTLVAVEEKLAEPPRLSVDGPNVKQLLASVLDISVKDIMDDADFEDLGLDSLTSIEALGALKGEFNLDLPGDFFHSYKTTRAVQSYLAARIRL
jgi:acyl carrier protein